MNLDSIFPVIAFQANIYIYNKVHFITFLGRHHMFGTTKFCIAKGYLPFEMFKGTRNQETVCFNVFASSVQPTNFNARKRDPDFA